MGLTNSQYNAIMRVYDRRQTEDRHILEEHRRTAFEAVPELKELETRAASLALQKARELLGNPTAFEKRRPGAAVSEASAGAHEAGKPQAPAFQIDFSKERRALLREHGFPEDYLDPVYECSDCHDTGFLPSGERCHCFMKETVKLFYSQAGMDGQMEAENFQTFSLDWYPDDLIDPKNGCSAREEAERALAIAKTFAAALIGSSRQTQTSLAAGAVGGEPSTDIPGGLRDTRESGAGNLLLYGQTGLGKTFLAHCIAKELIDHGRTVAMYSSGDLFDALARERFDRGDDESEKEIPLPDFLEKADLLIIDDLGTELTNSFVNSALFQVMNERLSKKASMLISTNLTLAELSGTYSERIFSRMMQSFRLVPLFGKDIRLQTKMQRLT